MSLVYDITFPSLPPSHVSLLHRSFFLSVFLLLEGEKKERRVVGVVLVCVRVCVCVFGGGDGGLAE